MAPATNQDIKDFFALSGNKSAVTNDQLTKLQTFIDSETDITGSTADDLADYIYEHLKGRVQARELGQAQDRVAQPAF